MGSYGTAIGKANNTQYTVLSLLQQVQVRWSLDTTEANAFNAIFDGINRLGDR